jgi:predicted chitinase
MIISPPFLPPRGANQSDDAWLDAAMTAPPSRLQTTGAPEGSFPLSNKLEWHNGMHLQGQAGANSQTIVRTIADGKVIYVGKPTKANNNADDAQNFNPFGEGATWTDNGCIIVKHTTEIGATGGQATEIVYYSVYMHLNEIAKITPTGQTTKRILQKEDPVWRKDEIGKAGQIYGHAGQVHLEICMDNANLTHLIGREPAWVDPANIPAPTVDGRTDAVFGSLWFYLPASTPSAAEEPASHLRGTNQPTLNQAIWLKMTYTSGACAFESYDNIGRSLGTLAAPGNAEYNLYTEASRRHNTLSQADRNGSSPSGWYELLRFGRNLGRGPAAADKDPLPANAAHWRRIPGADGQPIWADLNAEGTYKFSDADFLPIQGWNCVNDDSTPDDQRCDSGNLKNLIADPDTSNQNRMETTDLALRLGDQEVASKLRRMVCRFPSEWNQATIGTRYAFVKELDAFKQNPDAWKPQEEHLKALSFPDLPDEYISADWRFHPKEFIATFRKCMWLQQRDLKQIFAGIDNAYLAQVRDELNKVSGKHFLNTALRQAHFFGQIRQEAGASMAATSENLNYAPSVLKSKFSYYAQNPQQADTDGYTKDASGHITKAADQEAIANKAYGGRNGNDQPGDGWRYRGRGLKQVTGKENYGGFKDQYERYWESGRQNFVNLPDLLTQFPYSLRSAVWFWVSKGCMKPADTGIADANVDSVTAIVNRGELGQHNSDGSYTVSNDSPAIERRKFAKKAYEILN